jgi:hypothetical protein
MTDEEPVLEHPSVTVADKVGHKVAEHITAGRQAAAEAETARRAQAQAILAEVIHTQISPALKSALAPMTEGIAEDHPLKEMLEMLGSPESAVVAAIVDVIGFGLALFGALRQVPQILAENFVNDVNAKYPNVPLTPAVVANLIQTSYVGSEACWPGGFDAHQEASYGGIDAGRLDAMTYLSGNAPSPQDLFALYRRGALPYTPVLEGQLSVITGLLQGDTKNAWVEKLAELAHVWPTPTDFVAAAVREQVPYQTAKGWAADTGLDLTQNTTTPPVQQPFGEIPGLTNPNSFFEVLFDVAGRPPGPMEAGRMALRGIIPWGANAPVGYVPPPGRTASENAGKPATGPTGISFQQSIAESDLKTKWTEWLARLETAVPTNGEISEWLREGWLTAPSDGNDPDHVYELYQNNGIDQAVADIYIESALTQAVQQDKLQTRGTITSLYENRLMSYDDAQIALGALGYQPATADNMLKLANFRWHAGQYQRIIQEIGRQVISRKVSPNNASSSLAAMGVPADTVQLLLTDWQQAQGIEVPSISASQIASAVYYGVETVDDGFADLTALGYSDYDAWRLLSIRMHGPVQLTGFTIARPGQGQTPPPPVL